MNGKRTRRTGSNPRSPAKRKQRSKAVKRAAGRIAHKDRINKRALRKIRGR